MRQSVYDVIIIGGGLAGLSCALHLAKKEVDVLLIEKYTYPRHKVCGEYVSNEIVPYLMSLGVDPISNGAVAISKFEISTIDGNKIESPLPLGGFGMSRYALDFMMYNELTNHSQILIDTVTAVDFKEEQFVIITNKKQSIKAKFVIGAFGKRSVLDKYLDRSFINKRTHWMAIKAHFDYDFPEDTVALHNFEGGYCGLSKTETGSVNACYLTTLKSFNTCSGINDFQNTVMSRNEHLKHFFKTARPLFEKPLTISQISFTKKAPVVNHIFMLGDSAGLIHPLCGNGMAMAIHSAKIFSELFLKEFQKKKPNRNYLEQQYELLWNRTFSGRLRTGALIQKLLLNDIASNIAFKAASLFPSMIPAIIKKTHGTQLV